MEEFHMSGLSWLERLRFHEQEFFLRTRGYSLADRGLLQGHSVPDGTSAWEVSGKLRMLSLIVTPDHGLSDMITLVETSHLLGCEASIITPNCSEGLVRQAIKHAESRLAAGGYQGDFRGAHVNVHPLSKSSVGDVVWVPDSTKDSNASQVEVIAASMSDTEPVYKIRDNDNDRVWSHVPERYLYTSALAAMHETALVDIALAIAISRGIPFLEALTIAKRE